MKIDKVIRGNIVTPRGVLDGHYLAINNGKVVQISKNDPGSAKKFSNWEGAWIFPGVIDVQVHTRSQLNREGFDYATRAAAAGGVTTIIDMPYDDEFLVCSGEAVKAKAAIIERDSRVDVALHGTISRDDGISKIGEQVDAGVCSFKFSTFETHPTRFPRIPPYLMKQAFLEIAKHDLAAGVHNENDEVVRYELEQIKKAGRTDYLAHGESHSPLSELLAIVEVYEIGAHTGCRANIVHCSLGRGIDICESYRRQGFESTVEVCLHYLMFDEDNDVKKHVGLAKVNPPIRASTEKEALWRHLAVGNIDLVSTDHVAWSLERKNNPDMLKNSSGGPSLEVLLPLMIKGCNDRNIDLSMAARVLSANPAKNFRLSPTKGALQVGSDADFSVVDPTLAKWRVSQSKTVSDWSLYDGMEMPQIRETYVRGEQVWDGTEVVVESGYGRFIKPFGRV